MFLSIIKVKEGNMKFIHLLELKIKAVVLSINSCTDLEVYHFIQELKITELVKIYL